MNMDSCLSKFKVLLERVEENPDYESRITKKDSKFVELTWDIFLSLYERLRIEEENDVTKDQVETSGEELKDLVESGAIDDEGIWRLLELLNCRRNYISTIAVSAVKKDSLKLPLELEENSCDEESNDGGSFKGEEGEDEVEEDDDNNDGGSFKGEEEEDEVEDDDVDNNDGACSEKEFERNKDESPSCISSTKGPDFFDEKAMLKFLDKSERTDKDNQESDIDYFEELPSEDDSEASGIMYNDFFDEEGEEHRNNAVRKNSDENESEIDRDDEIEEEFEDNGDEESMDSGGEFDENMEENSKHIKSSFELKQERLKNKINKLEEEALMEKPWPLKGEVEARERPLNSLLEEIVEVDLSQRPAPVITKEVTMKLDDIIIKRIKDSAYDDVEKKLKPIQSPHEFKKAIVLDQEKSKLSLAEVYEKEYLKQKSDLTAEKDFTEKLTAEQEEIKKMMHSVFKKLDTLSNFHFVPKPAIPEIKIVTNLPAVMMEEVAPEVTSHGNLLAPEEISGESKRQLISKDERTSTDKKRERRKKKKLQALRAKRTEKISNTSVKHLTKSRNTKVLNEVNNVSVKTSKQFFTKFQEDLETSATFKKRKHDKSSTNLNAKKLKL